MLKMCFDMCFAWLLHCEVKHASSEYFMAIAVISSHMLEIKPSSAVSWEKKPCTTKLSAVMSSLFLKLSISPLLQKWSPLLHVSRIYCASVLSRPCDGAGFNVLSS